MKQWLSTQDASVFCGRSESTLRRLRSDLMAINAVQVEGRNVLYSREKLAEYFNIDSSDYVATNDRSNDRLLDSLDKLLYLQATNSKQLETMPKQHNRQLAIIRSLYASVAVLAVAVALAVYVWSNGVTTSLRANIAVMNTEIVKAETIAELEKVRADNLEGDVMALQSKLEELQARAVADAVEVSRLQTELEFINSKVEDVAQE